MLTRVRRVRAQLPRNFSAQSERAPSPVQPNRTLSEILPASPTFASPPRGALGSVRAVLATPIHVLFASFQWSFYNLMRAARRETFPLRPNLHVSNGNEQDGPAQTDRPPNINSENSSS